MTKGGDGPGLRRIPRTAGPWAQGRSLGAGVGLRIPHYQRVLDERPALGFVEVISENFFGEGGHPLAVLDAVAQWCPVALHGVGLGIGRTDALDARYLDHLHALVRRVEPRFVSDHLCWTGIDAQHGHDLWPLPYTEEALDHVAARVHVVQEHLGRPILLENVSSYLSFADSTLEEWDFLAALVARTGCGLLLDVNNVFVSSVNHGFDARTFLRAIPGEAVGYMHIAGHEDHTTHLLDTHDHPVREEVWALLAEAVDLTGCGAVSLERDDHIPDWDVLYAEVRRAADVVDAS